MPFPFIFPTGTIYVDSNVKQIVISEPVFACRSIEFDLDYTNVNHNNPRCKTFVPILMEVWVQCIATSLSSQPGLRKK